MDVLVDDSHSKIWKISNFLNPHVADTLMREMIRILDWQSLGNRQVCYFGDNDYGYGSVRHMSRSVQIGALVQLSTAVNEMFGVRMNSMLCNFYKSGENYIPLHSDDESSLGDKPVIISLSLGAKRVFRLLNKARNDIIDTELESGSLLIMEKETQRHWKHAILRSHLDSDPRLNITFRNIKY